MKYFSCHDITFADEMNGFKSLKAIFASLDKNDAICIRSDLLALATMLNSRLPPEETIDIRNDDGSSPVSILCIKQSPAKQRCAEEQSIDDKEEEEGRDLDVNSNGMEEQEDYDKSGEDNVNTKQDSINGGFNGDGDETSCNNYNLDKDDKKEEISKGQKKVKSSRSCNSETLKVLVSDVTKFARHQAIQRNKKQKQEEEERAIKYHGKASFTDDKKLVKTFCKPVKYKRLMGQKAATVNQIKCQRMRLEIGNLAKKTVNVGNMGSYEDEMMNDKNGRIQGASFLLDGLVDRPSMCDMDIQKFREEPKIIGICNSQEDLQKILDYLEKNRDKIIWCNSKTNVDSELFGECVPTKKKVYRKTSGVQSRSENTSALKNYVTIVQRTPIDQNKSGVCSITRPLRFQK